jgi:hypothetical protein
VAAVVEDVESDDAERNARDKYAAKMKKRKEKFENKRSKL